MPSLWLIGDQCSPDVYFVTLFRQVHGAYILVFRNNFYDEKPISFFIVFVIY